MTATTIMTTESTMPAIVTPCGAVSSAPGFRAAMPVGRATEFDQRRDPQPAGDAQTAGRQPEPVGAHGQEPDDAGERDEGDLRQAAGEEDRGQVDRRVG